MPRVNFNCEPAVRLPEEVLRKAIQDQACPWCHRGPFKVLASHCAQAHGIDRFTFRDWAGVFSGATICSSEVSQYRIDRSRKQYEAGLTGLRPFSAGQKRHRKNTAWHRLQRQKAGKVTHEGHVKAAKASRAAFDIAMADPEKYKKWRETAGGKGRERTPLRHGLSGYARDCRCETCRVAWRAYQNSYAAASRAKYATSKMLALSKALGSV